MREPLGKELYQLLVDTEFKFIGTGEKSIKEIYESVKTKYPEYCDDSLLCSEHCKAGAKQAEWKHIVRNALQTVKKNGKVIPTAWGYWMFTSPVIKQVLVNQEKTVSVRPLEVTKESSVKTFFKKFFSKW